MTAVLIISLSFTWLLWETDCLCIRLLVGELAKPKYARYEVYNSFSKRKYYTSRLRDGGNLPADYSPNGEPCYQIILNLGIKDILCGWEWLDEHCADMVDYQPDLQMNLGGIRYNMTIKQPSILKDVMKANKLTKKQKLAYI